MKQGSAFSGVGNGLRVRFACSAHDVARLIMLAIVLAVLPSREARAQDAEIVQLTGKGDTRETADADWRAAFVRQKLQGGWFVRTREMSQMALLLRDNTQVRLNQLSILNIKSVGTATMPTRLELPQGRAWSQAKQTSPGAPAERRARVEFTTPTATIGIRGTDWEIVVDKDGTSTVTVLSGEVDMYNDHGRVVVARNEQARAAPGRAPVKVLLTNAAERVQWVTAYRPDPRRWVKAPARETESIIRSIEAEEFQPAFDALTKSASLPRVEADLLLADLHIYLGEAERAIALLAPHARDGAGDPMSSALLARAYLVAGRIGDASRILGVATQKHANHVELLLSAAELARVQGDVDAARRASADVLRIEPNNAEAWFVIGRIETEREYAAAARDALRRAIELRPDGPGYRGELATLETFANEFGRAEEAFRDALAQRPDDFVALTGLGVLQLKRGEPEAALESFLKAGVIEPRYARAWLFSGVAYYQLGDRMRAQEAIEKASSLDEKDPLPPLMQSLVYFDSLELGKAIEAARQAQVRLPYLKSLNQVLTDQRGNANLGSALAAFGLEEWSQAYAYDSYSPYWAGSHLFLADRFSGTFNKNSELFSGFLSDPGVFGASNRFSSLVPVPGHYGSVELTAGREYITEVRASAALNGYSVSGTPLSYFVGVDKSSGDSRINAFDADGRMRADTDNIVVGLGLRPSHELAIFAFANASTIDGHIADRASGLTDDSFRFDYRRGDIGLNYKFSPTNHAWLKVGGGSEKAPVSGAFFSQDVADTLNTAFNTNVFTPSGRLNTFRYDLSQQDIQFRHTFDAAAGLQVSWGLEHAVSKKPFTLEIEFLPLRIHLDQDNRLKGQHAYVSGRWKVREGFEGQLDLHYQDTVSRFVTDEQVVVVGVGTFPLPQQSGETRRREINPRFGLLWRPAQGHTLRLAGQAWRKPPGVNTLSPVDTVGIALDDRIEADGGLLRRARLQHEMEWNGTSFFQSFIDEKRVTNLETPGAAIVPDLQLDQLEKLRNRKRVYAAREDYLEDTPKFGAGRVTQFGFAFNRLLSREHSLALRYVNARTRNTTGQFRDLKVPFHPQHYVNVALSWQPYHRWIVGPAATYRSKRFADEANTERLSAGWTFGLQAYWESEDKRLSVGAVIDQVHSNKQSSVYRHPVAKVQAAYRF